MSVESTELYPATKTDFFKWLAQDVVFGQVTFANELRRVGRTRDALGVGIGSVILPATVVISSLNSGEPAGMAVFRGACAWVGEGIASLGVR